MRFHLKAIRLFLAFSIWLTIASVAHSDQAGLLVAKGAHNTYNYVPSVIMHSDGTQKMWWCAGDGTDVILYRAVNANTQQVITDTTRVLMPSTRPSWDASFTCDPSVVMGNFLYPDGSGARYAYAMYYTATDSQLDGGTNNGVGVAFSNDGITCRKYPYPILRDTRTPPVTAYGFGEQSVISADGQSGIWMFAVKKLDGSPQHYHLYYSADGVTLQEQFQVTESGVTGNFITEADFAYDFSTGYVYMVTNRINAEHTIDIYKIAWTGLSNGTWTHVASLGKEGSYNPTPSTYEYNGGAGFLRNEFGNNSAWLPMLQVFFGAGTAIGQTDLWWWQTQGN